MGVIGEEEGMKVGGLELPVDLSSKE